MKFTRAIIEEYLSDFVVHRVGETGDREYENAYFDSRQSTPHSIFIALEGENTSGSEYIVQAVNNGATCVVVSDNYREKIVAVHASLYADVDFYFVHDPLRAFGALGKCARDLFSGHVIGIVGSVGKTTTKNMVTALCGEKVSASRESFNNETGVPLTLCEIDSESSYAVVEMGESHFGDLDYVASLVQPETLIITNVDSAHIEYLGDLHGVARTMNEAVHHVSPEGRIVVLSDLRYSDEVLEGAPCPIVKVGENGVDAVVSDIHSRDDVTHDFNYRIGKNEHHFSLPLVGRHFIENAALAITAVALYGESLDVLSERLSVVANEKRRMRVVDMGSYTVIDDCYNANPASMVASMKAVRELSHKHGGRSVFIMGPMRELGSTSDAHHSHMGNVARELEIDLFICVGAATHPGYETFGETAHYFETVDECCKEVADLIKDNDVVGIKASRGPNAFVPVLAPVVDVLTQVQ